ncbi:unnamed protein product [Arabidopsis halleri]
MTSWASLMLLKLTWEMSLKQTECLPISNHVPDLDDDMNLPPATMVLLETYFKVWRCMI